MAFKWNSVGLWVDQDTLMLTAACVLTFMMSEMNPGGCMVVFTHTGHSWREMLGLIFRFQPERGTSCCRLFHAEVVLSCTAILSTVWEIQPAEIWRRAGLFIKQRLVYPEPGLPPSRMSISVTGQIYIIVLHGASTKAWKWNGAIQTFVGFSS